MILLSRFITSCWIRDLRITQTAHTTTARMRALVITYPPVFDVFVILKSRIYSTRPFVILCARLYAVLVDA